MVNLACHFAGVESSPQRRNPHTLGATPSQYGLRRTADFKRIPAGLSLDTMSRPIYRLTGALSAWTCGRPQPVLTSIPAGGLVVTCGTATRNGIVEVRYSAQSFLVLWEHLCKHTSLPAAV